MDPTQLLALLISAGGAVGGSLAAGDDDASRAAAIKALASRQLATPGAQQQNAYQANTLNTADSQLSPEYQQALQAAFGKLSDISSSGGLTLQDQANQNNLLNQAAVHERAGRGAILEGMQARGQLGSGADLAAQLNNQQGAANRSAQVAQDTAGSAQARALQSIMAQGQMASSVGDKERQARTAIDQYNAGAQTRAQQYANQVGQNNYQNNRQNYQDQNQGYGTEAGLYGEQAQNTRNTWNAASAGGASLLNNASKRQKPSTDEDYP